MNENELNEIVEFKKVLDEINMELHNLGIFDIEYLLVNHSIDEVMGIIVDNIWGYNSIKYEKFDSGATFEDLIIMYMQLVKEKYDSMLIRDGKKDSIADRFYDKAKEPVNKQYLKSSIGMTNLDVENILMLMREAIIAYYKVYENKVLVAELITSRVDKSEYLEFTIKEEQLLHLLGVSLEQLRNNPDFVRLTGRKNMNSKEILEWILRDAQGNNNLLQYSDDFLKRISSGFKIIKEQYSHETKNRLLNYHKVGLKSQAFLKYGPFEKVSLVSKLQKGKSLTEKSKSNVAMISRAECFSKYPWAYFGSVQEPDKRYMETLVIDSASGKKELFRGSTPAIVRGVYRLNEDGSDGGGGRIFSEEEQRKLFENAYLAFCDVMNFNNLRDYFNELGYDNDLGNGRAK